MKTFKSIVLHIGPHKTGTSFIQEQLGRHRTELAKKGWAVPTGPFKGLQLPPNHSFLVSRLVNTGMKTPNMPRDLRDSDVPALFRNWLETCGSPHLLLSGEFMSWISKAEQWQELRGHLLPFVDDETKIRVFIFVRHPVDLALSFRNQTSKLGYASSFESFEQNVQRYEQFSSLLTESWGDEVSIEWHRYEDARKRGLWAFFVRQLGLDPQDYPDAISGRVNSSIPFETRLVLGKCAPPTVQPMVPLISSFSEGMKDGFTAGEAKEIWEIGGERINALLKEKGLHPYEQVEGRFDTGSPELWSENYVAEWKAHWAEFSPEFRSEVLSSYAAIASSSDWMHPEVRRRFNELHKWFKAQENPGGAAKKSWRAAAVNWMRQRRRKTRQE